MPPDLVETLAAMAAAAAAAMATTEATSTGADLGHNTRLGGVSEATTTTNR